MSRLGFALSMLAIVAVAAWAYHVNYRTQSALERAEALRRQIAAEREAIQVLRVEWAHMNAPARLEALVAAANRHLTLYPVTPGQFGVIADLPARPVPVPGAPDAAADESLSAGAAPAPAAGRVLAAEPRDAAFDVEAEAARAALVVDGLAISPPAPRPPLRPRTSP